MLAKYMKLSTARAILRLPPSHEQLYICLPGTFRVLKCYNQTWKIIDLTMNIIHVCIGLLMRKVLKKARIQVKSTLSYLSKRVVKLDHIDLFFLTQCPLWACHSQYWATMVPLNLGHHHSSINKNGIWKKNKAYVNSIILFCNQNTE